MADEHNKTPQEQDEQPREPYIPASPLKRIWAWVGVVYMVIIVLLMTYMYGTGTYLHGIASLMVIPALGGGGASAVCVFTSPQESRSPARRAMMIFITALCLALIVINLINGIPALLANFGG